MEALKQKVRSQGNLVLKERVMIYIINDEYPYGQHWHIRKPANITFQIPRLTRPPFPSTTQSSLTNAKPAVFFVDFACDAHCRTLGICVHYQFVLGSKKCPDGLICETCKGHSEQVAIKANRKCPMHFHNKEPNPIGSRPEDFLATTDQYTACCDILRRSLQNDWVDLAISKRFQSRSNLATTVRGRLTIREDAAEAQARMKRERTPKTIEDVRKLSDKGLVDSGYSSQSSFSEKDPRYNGLHDSLLTQGRPQGFGVKYAEVTDVERDIGVWQPSLDTIHNDNWNLGV